MASRLLPARMRPHIAAVYAFVRVADDIADENPAASPEERQARLRAWRESLHRAALDEAEPRDGTRDQLIVTAAAHSIRTLNLPLDLFDDLLSAFAQDTMTTRYDSWAEVFDYCRRSANPVGRLVLRIAGYDDADLERSSDALCTALQLTNFWQDFGRDWRAGRLYLPREEQRAFGADEQDLGAAPMTEAWQRAIAAAVEVTWSKFEEGRIVCDRVRGRLGLELRVTWLGGARILERVARGRTALLMVRPALGVKDAPLLVWRALRWQRT